MSIKLVSVCAVSIAVLVSTHLASAQNRPVAPSAPAALPNSPAPPVAEQAHRLLKEVSACTGSAQEFTFYVNISFDHVLPSGQKLQFSAAEDFALQRPGRMYVEWNGDLRAR